MPSLALARWRWLHGSAVPRLTAFGAAIAAAALAFLRFNFPPARIFMGDAGSIPLGFWLLRLVFWARNKICGRGYFRCWCSRPSLSMPA